MVQLTENERHSLTLVRDGMNVRSVAVASDLRAIECKYPYLVQLESPRPAYGAPRSTPYFYAMATPAGRQVLRQMRAEEELPPHLGEAMRDTTHAIYRAGLDVDA